MVAEGVKSPKRQTCKLNAWIFVPGTYFDDDEMEKFCGMVVSQFNDAVLAKWEDGYSAQVGLDDITLEPDYTTFCNSNENIIENIKTELKDNKAKGVKGLQLVRSALTLPALIPDKEKNLT